MCNTTATRALPPRLLACLAALWLAAPAAAAGGDPGSVSECLQMARAPLEARCQSLFAAAGQESQRAACLEQVMPQLEAVCAQFFGEGRDFCATCTTSCIGSFPAGDGQRRDCLAMCLRQPGCR